MSSSTSSSSSVAYPHGLPIRSSSAPTGGGTNPPALEASITAKYFFGQLLTPAFFLRACVLLLVFLVLLTPIFYLVGESHAVRRAPPEGEVFCSNGLFTGESVADLLQPWQKECLRCPIHGECRYGRVVCQADYFLVHRECIAEAEHTRDGFDMKERLIRELESHAGRRVCGDTTSAGAPSADLTISELQAYVRPFQPTSAEQQRFDRAWAFAQMWLNQEGVLTQNWRGITGNPHQRLLIVNEDSHQPVRFRAVYPTESFACRWRQQLHAQWPAILAWGCLLTLAAHLALAVWYALRWRALTPRIARSIREALRADDFVDVDASGASGRGVASVVRNHPHNVADLKAEFLRPPITSREAGGAPTRRMGAHGRSEEAAAGGGGGVVSTGGLLSLVRRYTTSTDAEVRLLYQLVWQSVVHLMSRSPEIECDVHTFQYGPATSWRWIGERRRHHTNQPTTTNATEDATTKKQRGSHEW